MRVALLLLLASLTFFRAHAQMPRIRLNPVEHRLDSVKHFKKVLIVAEGNIHAHWFVDMLAKELMEGLEKKGITCKYEYLGDEAKVNTTTALEKAKSWEHDAVFHLLPISNAMNTKTDMVTTRLAGQPQSNITTIKYKDRNYLHNEFNLQLEDGNNEIWASTLSVEARLGKKAYFKRLRVLILEDMERQLVLPD